MIDRLDVTLTDDKVGELVQSLNEVWAQAGVVWQIEQIVREPALNPDVFREVLNDRTGSRTSLVATVLPDENIRADIWNVFLVL